MGRSIRIFREIEPPLMQASLPINKFATWHTWSEIVPPFPSSCSRRSRATGSAAASPRGRPHRQGRDETFTTRRPSCLIALGAGGKAPQLSYDWTFSWSPDRWKDNGVRQRFISFARSLDSARPSRKIMLFDGLMKPDLTSNGMHALLALLRGALVELAGDERAAMYTPLGEVGKNAGAFPLHADLYIPHMLFNVFDEVSADDTGASTFLSVPALCNLLPSVRPLPARKRQAIIAVFAKESSVDRFEILYDLLHGGHRWVPALEKLLEERQFRIKLQTGQGYLLHDRIWLHGREAPRGGVPINRVRRFVFGGGLGIERRASTNSVRRHQVRGPSARRGASRPA